MVMIDGKFTANFDFGFTSESLVQRGGGVTGREVGNCCLRPDVKRVE